MVDKKTSLKPCPFCGEIPKLECLESSNKYYYACVNINCPCSPSTYAHKNKGVVARAWNKRINTNEEVK